MTDPEIVRLFTEGTAPERDAAFARRVNTRIRIARLRLPLVLAMRAAGVLVAAGAIHVTIRAIEPALPRLADGLPQFMGVPVPVVLVVLGVGVAVRALRQLVGHGAP